MQRDVEAGIITSMVNRKIKWSDLWHTLPSPVNLHLWKKTTPSCQLCGGGGGVRSLKHILNSCLTALADRQYRWFHDQISKEIVKVVNMAIRTNAPNYLKHLIRFVRDGVKAKRKEGKTPNALSLATDWEVRADLEIRLKFSCNIRPTCCALKKEVHRKRNTQTRR